MVFNLLGTLAVLIGFYLSNRSYDHAKRWYALDREPSASNQPRFRHIYTLIRVLVPIASIGSFWTDSPLLLRLYANHVALGLGVLASMAGLLLFWSAKRTLGISYSPCFDAFLPRSVVSTGPYRFVRHPIYSGNLLALGSLALGTGSLWLIMVFLITLTFYVKAARIEDAELSCRFPGRGEARYRFVPFVY